MTPLTTRALLQARRHARLAHSKWLLATHDEDAIASVITALSILCGMKPSQASNGPREVVVGEAPKRSRCICGKKAAFVVSVVPVCAGCLVHAVQLEMETIRRDS